MAELERLLTDHGGMGAFAALIILKIGELIWSYLKTRDKVTDDSIHELKCSVEKAVQQMAHVQSQLHKVNLDLRKAFYALKKVLGPVRWAEVSEEMRHFTSKDINGG